ncbi:MAG TPA: YncE family protein [Terracidiphilus sp.]|jgi:YVTN family beta-propeller protein|nr:YncE family protein [Terracidiphilus sp.]
MPFRPDHRFVLRAVFLSIFLFGVIAASRPISAQTPYRILDKWKLDDAGGWDYLLVDSPAQRIYITRGDHVDVVDATTGKLAGTISGLHGTHGIALDTTGKIGWVTDGGGNAVVAFDRATLATVATIPAGTGPDGMVFEPATQTVWAFNGRSKNVTVIDAATEKVVATIDLPGKPEFPVVDGKGIVFDNIEDKSEVVRLDAHSRTLTATWPAGCESPSGLAFDVPGHRLFPVCDGNKMSVIDSNSGKVLANPGIGDGPDAAGWSANHKLAFASSGDGILSVVDTAKPGYPTIESLPTQRGARTMAYDPATDRVYLVTADFGPRPTATAENPRPRPPMIPGSFTILVVGR